MIWIGKNGDLVVSGRVVVPGAFPGVAYGTPFLTPIGWQPFGFDPGPGGVPDDGSSTEPTSGFWSGNPIGVTQCCRCKKNVSMTGVTASFCSGEWVMAHYCFSCAGLNEHTKWFYSKEHWIRESVPLAYDTPHNIIADWLDDQGKQNAADYMRNSLLTSGG